MTIPSTDASDPIARLGLITTNEAARRLGVTAPRVRQMKKAGLLPARKIGRDLFFDPADVETLRQQERGPGRPRTLPPS